MSKDRKDVYRVGISGSYGGLNLGDEAILEVIITELRRALPVEITVFSRNADHTRRHHHVDRVIAVRELSRGEVQPEIARLDLLILGGGGILFDSEAAIFVREAQIAEEIGIPVLVYAVSAGPLQQSSARKIVCETLDRATFVTVRERHARHLLEEIGVRQTIEVTADPTFLLEPAPIPPERLAREGLETRSRVIGISVREPGGAAPDIDEKHYHALLANAADYMVDRLDADLVFVPMERNVLDMQHSHRVIGQMAYANRASVLKETYTPAEMLSLVGRFEFVVGMRLHFLIFAAIQSVPFVALPYAGKVSGLLEALEMPSPPVQQVNAGQLIAHIDRSWDLREALRERMLRTLPPLRELARRTNALAVELLTAANLGAAVEG